MTTPDSTQAKKNKLARQVAAPTKPVSTAFRSLKPTEPEQIWNVKIPESLFLDMKEALLSERTKRGHRVTAKDATVEALRSWLNDRQ